jgi:AcrR family transcriptional regulator
LQDKGEAQFSTHSVCAIAKVTAPTLYHHYGSGDGLLSAAIAEAFAQFIPTERRLAQTVEEIADLVWASAHAASLLHVTAQLRKTAPPTSAVLEQIRTPCGPS